jgi:Ca2+-binding RTX toxin-like protein
MTQSLPSFLVRRSDRLSDHAPPSASLLQHSIALIGTERNDVLSGSADNDTINGLGGNDTIFGGAGSDRIAGGDGSDSLDGGAGNDWLDNSDMNHETIVVLYSGVSWNNDGSNDSVINFENVIGTRFVDTIYGDGNSNILRGGAGADVLDGIDGSDWSDYRSSKAGVLVNLATGVTAGGDAAGDRLRNIERLMGSAQADVLTGDGGQNVIRGGAGADTLDGGSNIDWVDYRGSAFGVTVNLATGSASGGDATGDSITNFERIFGSAQGDMLTGDTGANMLYGGAGNDTLNGGAGRDILRGDAGADTFVFSSAADIGIGAPPERIVDFTHGDDLLDFSALDMAFIGNGAFGNVAGQLRYDRYFDAVTLMGDMNGDGAADFQIVLTLNTQIVAADLIL